jgi:hypothetical protein
MISPFLFFLLSSFFLALHLANERGKKERG